MNDIELKLEELRIKWKEATDEYDKEVIEEEADRLKCRHTQDGKRCGKPIRNMDSYSCESCYMRMNPKKLGKLSIPEMKDRIKNMRSTLV